MSPLGLWSLNSHGYSTVVETVSIYQGAQSSAHTSWHVEMAVLPLLELWELLAVFVLAVSPSILAFFQRGLSRAQLCENEEWRFRGHLLHQWNHGGSQDGGTFPVQLWIGFCGQWKVLGLLV